VAGENADDPRGVPGAVGEQPRDARRRGRLAEDPLTRRQQAVGIEGARGQVSGKTLFDVLLPVVFLLFGVWWIYRGLQARRRKNVAADDVAATTTKTRLVKGSPR